MLRVTWPDFLNDKRRRNDTGREFAAPKRKSGKILVLFLPVIKMTKKRAAATIILCLSFGWS